VHRDRSRLPALVATLVAAVVVAAACGKSTALGRANSLIVVHTGGSLWEEVADTTSTALEPTFFSVRDEKKFFVEPVDTARVEDFRRLRIFRRVIVFGTPDNRHLRKVAREAGVDPDTLELPAIVVAEDVWAHDQLVRGVVLDPERPAESWRRVLPELQERIDERYRQFTRARMFTSGVDSASRDSLRRKFGFLLTFPRVYRVSMRGEETGPVVIRNDNPDPSQLIRSVLVDWRDRLDSLSADAAYGWRAEVDSVHYNVPQSIRRFPEHTRRFELDGREALEVRGAWADERSGFPAGGPFVSWLIQCPDRTYFLDGWVYAPERGKWQYVVQVRNIMRSFECEEG